MVETQKNLLIAEKLLEGRVDKVNHPEPFRLDAEVAAGNLTSAVRMLFNTEWGYLAAITGIVQEAQEPAMEVLYHFCSADAVVTLRLRTPRENAHIPSVRSVIPAAESFERELSELFGVRLDDAGGAEEIFAPSDWTGEPAFGFSSKGEG
jgi:NADH-quinone oxidoreductase subunit C